MRVQGTTLNPQEITVLFVVFKKIDPMVGEERKDGGAASAEVGGGSAENLPRSAQLARKKLFRRALISAV